MDPSPTLLPPCEANPACEPESSSLQQITPNPKPAARKRGKNKTPPPGPPAPPPPPRPRTFPQFPELPYELRLAIWEIALPAGPRLILPHFLNSEGTVDDLGERYYLFRVKPPALLWACREANAVARKGVEVAAASPGGWLDLRDDIVLLPSHCGMWWLQKAAVGQLVRPVLAGAPVALHDAPRMAVEIQMGGGWTSLLICYIPFCLGLVRLFLVVSCDRPTQRALDEGWMVAEQIHRGCQAKRHKLWRPSNHPPPEIVILLKRRKNSFFPSIWSMDSKDFLSKFTAVVYKPGHKAEIGRHGVLRSILPIAEGERG